MNSFSNMYPMNRRRGFTLIELLIAMTITLLLMAALGKAFATIGRSMKEGRSQVTLSGKLRSVSFRLRGDLRSRTVEARAPIKSGDSQGYFMYYEGPFTEQTAALFGDEAIRQTRGGDRIGSSTPGPFGLNSDSPTYYRHSRMGDIDDYVAFTAEAPANSWFTGKVPAYMVDNSPAALADPMEPRVIRSKYAEIIIWATPKWQVNETTKDLNYAPAPSGMPLYVDDNNDLIPDSVTLHRRVLLIRPDLNETGTINTTAAGSAFDSPFLRTRTAGNPTDVPPALRPIYPIGLNAGAYYPDYVRTPTTAPANVFNSHWLMGMTPIHQFYDLSLRRIVHPVTGQPTEYVAANSLEDLSEPHNRFGHVRYPGRYFGFGADSATSMPLLALAWNDVLLRRATVPAWFPIGYPSQTTVFNGTQRTSLFNGWLLPHFALGDPNGATADSSHWQRGYLSTFDARWDRTGEDVIAVNVHAFDVKGFDPTAPVFLTSGMDGAPGQSGIDDDASGSSDTNDIDTSSGTAQVRSELGAIGSDDVVVRVGDIAVHAVMTSPITDTRDAAAYNSGAVAPNGGRQNQMLASNGDFVDLYYPYLAGGPLLDLTRRVNSRLGISSTPPNPPPATFPAAPSTAGQNAEDNYGNFLQSGLSGWPMAPNALNSLKSSGKLHHRDAAGNYSYFQPCFDTWTDRYESDGFDQTQSSAGAIVGSNGTLWVLYRETGGYPGRAPLLPSGPIADFSIDTGLHDPSNPESLPPIAGELPAISVTVRVADPSSDEISQITVVEDLLD